MDKLYLNKAGSLIYESFKLSRFFVAIVNHYQTIHEGIPGKLGEYEYNLS